MSLFPGADAARAATARCGYERYADATNRAVDVAAVDLMDAAQRDAERQLEELRVDAPFNGVVFVAAGTRTADYYVDSAITVYIGERSDGDVEQVDADGAHGPDPTPPPGVGVLWPFRPHQTFEISPASPLRKIFAEKIPLKQGAKGNTPSPCDLGTSCDCSNRAVLHAIHYVPAKRLVIVWRCCSACARCIDDGNRGRGRMAEISGRNARWVTDNDGGTG